MLFELYVTPMNFKSPTPETSLVSRRRIYVSSPENGCRIIMLNPGCSSGSSAKYLIFFPPRKKKQAGGKAKQNKKINEKMVCGHRWMRADRTTIYMKMDLMEPFAWSTAEPRSGQDFIQRRALSLMFVRGQERGHVLNCQKIQKDQQKSGWKKLSLSDTLRDRETP